MIYVFFYYYFPLSENLSGPAGPAGVLPRSQKTFPMSFPDRQAHFWETLGPSGGAGVRPRCEAQTFRMSFPDRLAFLYGPSEILWSPFLSWMPCGRRFEPSGGAPPLLIPYLGIRSIVSTISQKRGRAPAPDSLLREKINS